MNLEELNQIYVLVLGVKGFHNLNIRNILRIKTYFSYFKIVLLYLLILLSISCSNEQILDTKFGNLPASIGANNEIIVVIDSVQWYGELGKTLRGVFDEVLITPQPESLYTLLDVSPSKLNHVLQRHHNLVFITALELENRDNLWIQKWFSEENIKKIQTDTSFYMFQKNNLYAKDQVGVFLVANRTTELIEKLKHNKQRIRNIFDKSEMLRWQKSLYKNNEQTNLAKQIFEKHDYHIRIPEGYQLVKEQKNGSQGFTWLRFVEAEYDKHLFIAYHPYNHTDQLKHKKIIDWRNQIAKSHLFGDPADTNSFILTETLEKPVFDNILFKKCYTVRVKGLWKTYNYSAGGPFISYVVVDEKKGMLYYVESFILAPSKKKRDFLREAESMILSFEL